MLYLKSIFDFRIVDKNRLNLEEIDTLPPGMNGFYLSYFKRKFPDTSRYEDEYLDFVSLLVSQEGLEEVLIKDMLQLSDRNYQKLKSAFGSLLELEDEMLMFYHKSLFEWLSDYDMSGDYSADMQKGQKLYDDFLPGLTAEAYKEEYASLLPFNIQLADYHFDEQKKSLEAYFNLLENIAVEKKIEILEKLGSHYSLYNKMYKAVVIKEEIYDIVKPLYDSNKEDWAEKYTTALNNLASSYKAIGKTQEAIALYEESLAIRKRLYEAHPDRWAEKYTTALNNLASSYKAIGKTQEAIALEEESLAIKKG
jgi:tetratricopeptide (TPR) repeat protein